MKWPLEEAVFAAQSNTRSIDSIRVSDIVTERLARGPFFSPRTRVQDQTPILAFPRNRMRRKEDQMSFTHDLMRSSYPPSYARTIPLSASALTSRWK